MTKYKITYTNISTGHTANVNTSASCEVEAINKTNKYFSNCQVTKVIEL